MKRSIELDGEDAERFETVFEAFDLANRDLVHQQRIVTEKYRSRVLAILKRYGLDSLPDFSAKLTDDKGQPKRPIVVTWDDGKQSADVPPGSIPGTPSSARVVKDTETALKGS